MATKKGGSKKETKKEKIGQRKKQGDGRRERKIRVKGDGPLEGTKIKLKEEKEQLGEIEEHRAGWAMRLA